MVESMKVSPVFEICVCRVPYMTVFELQTHQIDHSVLGTIYFNMDELQACTV